jgi:uncharacterized protein with HEPN domain
MVLETAGWVIDNVSAALTTLRWRQMAEFNALIKHGYHSRNQIFLFYIIV